MDLVMAICRALDLLYKKYGNPIVDGPELDWGQVICRMRLGSDWGNHKDFEKGPTFTDLNNCNNLYQGKFPEWILNKKES